jgi:hypothetical protein
VGCEGTGWNDVAQLGQEVADCECGNEHSDSIQC